MSLYENLIVKLSTDSYSVAELIRLANAGKIALPEFQRPYEWPPGEILELLRTVARNWPAGSFLLLELEARSHFETRELEGARALRKPDLMILDGQQRMTALFQTLTDRAPEIYYVELSEVVANNGLDDDNIKYENRARFQSRFKNMKEQAAAGIAPVYVIFDDEKFSEWVSFLSKADGRKAWAARKNYLSGLTDYHMPAVKLSKTTTLAALAKIFETTNRRGIRLKPWHLMVARMFPYGFRLRDEHEAALAKHPNTLGAFDIDGMEILKVVALREHLRQKRARQQRGRRAPAISVRGVRESDVLELEPKVVKRDWAKAVKEYAKALDFARDSCGVVRGGLLPAPSMVLPLADALSGGRARSGWRDDLERWFWTACFAQTYSQGANTQAVSDTESLQAWRADRRAVPDDIRNFSGDLLDELLIDQRRRNEMLVRGLLCLLTQNNAMDWVESKVSIRETHEPLQIHHCFAQQYAKAAGTDEVDVVANFALIRASTNGSIRNESPHHVTSRKDVSRVSIESHRISFNAFKSGNWLRFRDDRARQLKVAILEAVKAR
jgi:hypothetical protein